MQTFRMLHLPAVCMDELPSVNSRSATAFVTNRAMFGAKSANCPSILLTASINGACDEMHNDWISSDSSMLCGCKWADHSWRSVIRRFCCVNVSGCFVNTGNGIGNSCANIANPGRIVYGPVIIYLHSSPMICDHRLLCTVSVSTPSVDVGCVYAISVLMISAWMSCASSPAMDCDGIL